MKVWKLIPGMVLCLGLAFAGQAEARSEKADGKGKAADREAKEKPDRSVEREARRTERDAKKEERAQKREQVRGILRDFIAKLKENRKAAAECSKALVEAAVAVLQLDEAGADALETALEAAYDKAIDGYNELEEAEQVEAKLKEMIVAAMNEAFAAATNDAAQLATLATHAQTFADCIAPLYIAFQELKAEKKAQMKEILGKKKTPEEEESEETETA